jgi:hypothetical protein
MMLRAVQVTGGEVLRATRGDSEDGGGPADAERQREHSGGGEHWRGFELAEGVTDRSDRALHADPLDGSGAVNVV